MFVTSDATSQHFLELPCWTCSLCLRHLHKIACAPFIHGPPVRYIDVDPHSMFVQRCTFSQELEDSGSLCPASGLVLRSSCFDFEFVSLLRRLREIRSYCAAGSCTRVAKMASFARRARPWVPFCFSSVKGCLCSCNVKL